jgi:hypothetical protein
MAKFIGCVVLGLITYALCHTFGCDAYYVVVGGSHITLSLGLGVVVFFMFSTK